MNTISPFAKIYVKNVILLTFVSFYRAYIHKFLNK